MEFRIISKNGNATLGSYDTFKMIDHTKPLWLFAYVLTQTVKSFHIFVPVCVSMMCLSLQYDNVLVFQRKM